VLNLCNDNNAAFSLKNKLAANIAVTSLVTVQSQLQALDQFLDQYKGFTASPTPDNRPTGVDADAWRVRIISLSSSIAIY
jgi:hypothetical protein